jgi:hypothetical protein
MEIRALYALTVRPDTKGGRYETQLGYSLVLK